jgi:hypothetical protein
VEEKDVAITNAIGMNAIQYCVSLEGKGKLVLKRKRNKRKGLVSPIIDRAVLTKSFCQTHDETMLFTVIRNRNIGVGYKSVAFNS